MIVSEEGVENWLEGENSFMMTLTDLADFEKDPAALAMSLKIR